jgi:hypothetical protein
LVPFTHILENLSAVSLHFSTKTTPLPIMRAMMILIVTLFLTTLINALVIPAIQPAGHWNMTDITDVGNTTKSFPPLPSPSPMALSIHASLAVTPQHLNTTALPSNSSLHNTMVGPTTSTAKTYNTADWKIFHIFFITMAVALATFVVVNAFLLLKMKKSGVKDREMAELRVEEWAKGVRKPEGAVLPRDRA